MANADSSIRPKALVPDFGAIPHYLRNIPHWVLWRYYWASERKAWTKLPVQPSGSAAKSNDSLTWSPFHDVLSTYESQVGRFDGVSLALTPEMGIVGVDLDKMVIQEQGRYVLNKWASRIAELLPGYTEISPSGTGLRIMVKGTIDRALKQGATEIYNSGRFLTITGCVWYSPDTLPDCTEPLAYIISRLRPQPPESRPTPAPLNLDANALLQRAFQSQNGWAIQQLYSGDTSAYGGDQSSADLALCGHLAFWSKGDRNLLDQMFRSSSLMRPKWDKSHSGDGRTYGQMTIDKALSGQTEFYGERKIERPVNRVPDFEKVPTEEEAKARIINLADLAEQANQIRKNPINQGLRLSIGPLADYYRIVPGRLTVIVGTPGSGKTTFISEVLRHCVNEHNWKIAICSFETRPVAKVLLNINRSEIGKPSYPSSYHPGMTDEEHYQASKKWDKKLFVIDVAENEMNVPAILSYVDTAVKEHGINGFLLDPWSDLDPPMNQRQSETQFVKEQLNRIRHFAQRRGLHVWIVCHPSKAVVDKGTILEPNLYHINGSSEYNNKCDTGIALVRGDPTSNQLKVKVLKNKFDEAGRCGEFYLMYNQDEGRYSHSVGDLSPDKRNYLYKKDNDEAF